MKIRNSAVARTKDWRSLKTGGRVATAGPLAVIRYSVRSLSRSHLFVATHRSFRSVVGAEWGRGSAGTRDSLANGFDLTRALDPFLGGVRSLEVAEVSQASPENRRAIAAGLNAV